MSTKQVKQVIVRGRNSGVHYGTLEKVTKSWVYLQNSRRVWYWSGAASLSQLAGFGGNDKSKICVPVSRIRIAREDVCEVIECAPPAIEWFAKVAEWRV